MRNSFYILLASVSLLASRGYSATDTKSGALTFYVVSEKKIDGGRFIDTPDFPKLGYIAAKPDLVITQLVAVSETVAHSSMGKIGKDGKLTETPLPDQPALIVRILPADAQKFESLTEQSIGKRVLLMVGDTPLIAPVVHSPISTQSFQITIGERSDQKVIEDALKKLVH
jgi:preprotein translocase subunit SecD